MAKYFIVWNDGGTEGFITTDKAAVKTAIKNTPDRSRGYPSRSSLAAAFYETYGDEKLSTQTVDIQTT